MKRTLAHLSILLVVPAVSLLLASCGGEAVVVHAPDGTFDCVEACYCLDDGNCFENHAPVANAGSDLLVHPGEQVMLDATQSYDEDDDELYFQWVQIYGPPVELTGSDTPTATFTAPMTNTVLTFKVEVSDPFGGVDSDEVMVTVKNAPPVAVAGQDFSAIAGTEVVLDGSQSTDQEGMNLTYTWTQIGGDVEVELIDADQAQAKFIAPMQLVELEFQLVVSDGIDQSQPDTVKVTITNTAPVADAGEDLEVSSGEIVTLDGSGSYDDDGHPLTYHWEQIEGLPVELSDAESLSPTFSAPEKKGNLVFRLVVSDGIEESEPDNVTVTVLNNPPVADAGEDQEVQGGTIVYLSGESSFDQDGDPLTFNWTQVSGLPIQFDDPTSPTPSFVAPVPRSEVIIQLVVSDGEAESEPDEVVIKIMNNPPVADAGEDQVVVGGAVAMLDGTGSYDLDGDELTYSWSQIEGPTVELSNPTSPTPTFEAPQGPTSLLFSLVVGDGFVNSEPDYVLISVDNTPPLADAGKNQVVEPGQEVMLDGTSSMDPDGDELIFEWEQIEGTDVELSDPTSPTPTFTAPDEIATLQFKLIVSDGVVQSQPDFVFVYVGNNPPVANAGEDVLAKGGELVTLDGTGSYDTDGQELTYAWTQVDGTPVELDDPSSAQPSFTAPVVKDELVFELTVSDGFAFSEPDQVSVHINNTPPVADAGVDQNVLGGDAVQLDGSASYDPDGDELSFVWKQASGPDVILSDPEGVTPSFVAPPGKSAIVFCLVVDDGTTKSEPDCVQINVDNVPPIADAGQDKIVEKGEVVTLDATASYDPDGDELTYKWTQVVASENPEAIEVALSDPTSPTPTFIAPMVKSKLEFKLVVFDGYAESEPDVVLVHVGNNPPVADAGLQKVVQPGDVVTLDGSGSYDPDGDELSYHWTQVDGPQVTLDDPNSPTPTFTAPSEKCALTFQLVVNDGYTDSEPDMVIISVGNIPPVADAGDDQYDVDHSVIVQLDGSASYDLDGDPLSYKWSQVQGPEVKLSDPLAVAPTFLSPDIKTELKFKLVVNDGTQDSEPDYVAIFTKNNPPVAVIVTQDLILEGGELVELDGSASFDKDGDQLMYQWTQVEGPEVELEGADTAMASFVAPQAKGVLVFELVVYDGEEYSEPALIQVEIVNHAPVADAGADQSVKGGSMVTLHGNASFDIDGDELTYQWTQLSGEPVELSDPTAVEPTFQAPIKRQELVFELVVSDSELESEPDTVVVSIENNEPVAEAGPDQTVVGGSLVQLDGSNSYDLDEDELDFEWEQVEGPEITLFDASTPTPSFYAPVPKCEIVVSLKVFDGLEWSELDYVTITVKNNAPVANAGEDQNVEGGEVVVLDGSASFDVDQDELSYQWTQIEGPKVQLTGADTASPFFTAPAYKTTLKFELVVFDGEDYSEPDIVTVYIANNPPIADAGQELYVQSGEFVSLDGTGSYDIDGDDLEYQWTQVSGESVTLSDSSSPTPSFTAPSKKGTLIFELKVFDGTAWSEPDQVYVYVANNPPIANAGDDIAVQGGAMVTLDATGSYDPDDDMLTYMWTQESGLPVKLSDPESPTPTFTAPVPKGELVFKLVVNDGMAASEPDFVTVTVLNNAPVADAGLDQSVKGGTEVQLNGTGSSDVDGDELTYNWTQLSGEEVQLSNPTSPTPTFTAPIKKQELKFQLVVSDGEIQSEPDTVTVTVQNNAPVANAGQDQLVDGETLVQLDGTSSYDIDGDELSYLWTQESGGAVLLSDPTSPQPTFIAPKVKTTIVIKLVVSDGDAESEPDYVTIQVKNNPPVADAGADQNVEGGSMVILDGSNSYDIDGDQLAYQWTQIDGPDVNLSDPAAEKPSFQAPEYKSALTFELIVYDGEAFSEPDYVTISVANNAPVADAGPDQIVEDGQLVQLDGSGSFDIDGDALSFEWTQTAGTPVELSDPSSPTPTFTAPSQKDTLVFELRVFDGTVWSEPDQVSIFVANNPPVADAGPDQEVEGGSIVYLDGTGSSDPDGDPLSYNWTQSGGTPVQLSDPTSPTPYFEAPIPAQELVFVLVVNDGSVDSDPDKVSIFIKNHPPVADAGPDQEVEGESIVQLDGTGSYDLDGDSLTYQWDQVDGPEVVLSDPTAPQPTFLAPLAKTTLTFKLVVFDGTEYSLPDTVNVIVKNHPPVADAGPDQVVPGDSQVQLDGTGSYDLDGDALSYEWTQIEGPEVVLSDPGSATPTFTAPPTKTALTFQLIVFDGQEFSEADYVTISVANNPPVADAGLDQQVENNVLVTLDGTGSHDPDGDELTYKWTQIDGIAVSLSDPTSPQPTFTSPNKATIIVFELVVNDGTVDSEPDTVQIIVGNIPPVADAGPDQDVEGGSVVQLDGTESYDANGDNLTYEWTQLQGDPVDLSDPTSPTPLFTAPIPQQTLVFELVVFDGIDSSDPDLVYINVLNNPPVADAGPDQIVNGGSIVTLDGTNSSDVDGDPLQYQWTQLSGDSVTLSDPSSATPTFTAPIPKQDLLFELTVTDDEGETSSDTVVITVKNNPPVANAGSDICALTNTPVCLDGTDSYDVDGDEITYSWTQIDGENVILDAPDSATPCFTAPIVPDTLQFALVVNDGELDSDPDAVTVYVVWKKKDCP